MYGNFFFITMSLASAMLLATPAERALVEGFSDMMEFGRQSIADPDWPNKVKEGKVDEIRRCTRCLQCLMRMMSGLQPRCAVNPEVGTRNTT